jgi:hypothetical protein
VPYGAKLASAQEEANMNAAFSLSLLGNAR